MEDAYVITDNVPFILSLQMDRIPKFFLYVMGAMFLIRQLLSFVSV
jgi:hypothetical protein